MQFTILYSPEEHREIAKALQVAASVEAKEGRVVEAARLTKLSLKIEHLLAAQDFVTDKNNFKS